MKEKLLWSTLVVLSLLLILAHAQTPARSDSQIGRYQIFIAPGNANEEVQVFRLDTVTGKTWGKAYMPRGDQKEVGFVVLPDYPEGKAQRQ